MALWMSLYLIVASRACINSFIVLNCWRPKSAAEFISASLTDCISALGCTASCFLQLVKSERPANITRQSCVAVLNLKRFKKGIAAFVLQLVTAQNDCFMLFLFCFVCKN